MVSLGNGSHNFSKFIEHLESQSILRIQLWCNCSTIPQLHLIIESNYLLSLQRDQMVEKQLWYSTIFVPQLDPYLKWDLVQNFILNLLFSSCLRLKIVLINYLKQDLRHLKISIEISNNNQNLSFKKCMTSQFDK